MNPCSRFYTRVLFASLIASLVQANAFAQRTLSRPPEPTTDCRQVYFGGTVTEITKTSISIRWGDDEKAKTFLLSETLAAGKIPTEPRQPIAIPGQRIAPDSFLNPIFMYRATDVKVGDLVVIFYAHLNGKDICDSIQIQKRPGGRVPPLPEEAEKLLNPAEIIKAKFPDTWQKWKDQNKDFVYIPYHEKMNAHWDLEDKGIPYPEKFGRDRRFPTAPMPREVKEEPPVPMPMPSKMK